MLRYRISTWAWVFGLLVGCGPSAAAPDAGGATDAGATDAGRLDAGRLDAAPADAGIPTPDAEVPGLCDLPAANLISAGDFEGGMDGLAPTGWQVRNPDAPSTCSSSGSPGEHVYLTASAPQCGGQALVIDSRGQWDCYAVQNFTDYNTIFGGRTYTLSAAVRSEGQDNPAAWFVLGLQWLDAADQVFGDEKNPEPADVNYDWKLLSFSLVAPADARRAVVWLTGHYPGRVTFDKISLVEEN